MTGNEKRPLMPRLRFPEFKEAKTWGFQPLSQLAKRSTRKNVNCEIARVLTNSAEYGVVDQRDFFDKDIANQGNLQGYYIVDEGAYVYNPRISATAPVGPISKNKIGLGVMSPLYTVFKFNSSKNEFYAHYFKATHWHQYMRQAASTGARHDRMSITNDDFMSLPLPVSTPEEQQKIADCLSSLDELITAETQKLDTLKTHKKGLMQQLFPREGETVPRLRFSEFRKASDWNTGILGELSEVVRGGSPRPIDGFLTTAADGLNWLKIGDVDKEAKYVTQTAEKVRPEALNKTRVVNPGALILSNSMSFGRPYILQIKTCIHDGWIAITNITKQTDRDFLYYAISAPSSQNYFINNAAGSGVQNLNVDIVKNLSVCFPSTVAEQQKIADCLSSIDNLITAQSQKVNVLKTLKKGLMQQLFPVSDEVCV
jgi:type I restriction enzyme S subunit